MILIKSNGGIAQMVEHRPDKAKAESSILSIPTKWYENADNPKEVCRFIEEMITVPITYCSEGKLHTQRYIDGRWVHTKGA